MSYTADQEKVVLKILSYKAHEYYEILSVERTASEPEIKKSYRKLAIKLHPDKNQHPRSAEAFKYLNKAWEVLGDSSKRRIYDQTGSDPDARFNPSAGGSGGGFSGGGRSAFNAEDLFGSHFRGGRGGGGGAFGDDDIFNFFFGGNQGQTFTFGNNGFTFQSFGGGGPRGFGGQQARQRAHQQQQRNQQQQAETPMLQFLQQVLPVLLVLVVPMILQFFSGKQVPEFSHVPTTQHTVTRTTPNYNIPFFVTEGFNKDKKLSRRQMQAFDTNAEHSILKEKRARCNEEMVLKNELIEQAHGWFSVDQEKLAHARSMAMPNCEFLRDLNLI
ncbi:uncharacterized protein KQ657_004939 [Scheffersomyces spartinae]|uniref:J domain-containing protein n=1 Tax=Scheffersomyces spartinae TaxID=45513 RepID=A0A9P7VA84_9ASCO|nr:uncharacterized protein KQ657_004939 [Scheffersomyces spartinae]KAG7194224.1 hypothetical protein KQ657_004939 [Scheffersomyces spartinae]